MGFWDNFWALIRFKPMPLSEEWQNLSIDLYKSDAKSPVQLIKLSLNPEPMLMRRYISVTYMQAKIQEIVDYMYFFASNQAREAPGFIHIEEDSSQFYGTVNLIWVGKNQVNEKNKKYHPGLNIRSPQEISPAQEQTMRRSLEAILQPLTTRPDVGFNLEFKISPAHPKWKKPQPYKNLDF